jgi:hypothetical protein
MMENSTLEKAAHSRLSRRRFFGLAGALAGAGIITSVAGCKKTEDDPGINLGSGDTGVLNYAYALEQLEAAFYIQVIANQYIGMSDLERDYFMAIRNHEIAHREFFKNVLGGAAIAALEFDFSTIDFQKRSSVLDTAITFEDLGVSAYNGAGQLLTSADNLTIAGKIVSVEARHAAALRDIRQSGSFADTSVVDATNGLDIARFPNDVLAVAGAFMKTKLNTVNLPNS